MRTPKFPLKTIAPQSSKQNRNAIAEWAATILLLLFGTTTLCQAFVIPTGSMEDTLRVGDHLLVDKLAYSPAGSIGKYLLPYQEPKHGDIIVFRYPPDTGQTLVKRLIGMPGDRLRIANGVVYRNGKRLNEPYVYHKYAYDPALDNFPWPCCRPVKEDLARKKQEEMLNQNVSSGDVIVPGLYTQRQYHWQAVPYSLVLSGNYRGSDRRDGRFSSNAHDRSGGTFFHSY